MRLVSPDRLSALLLAAGLALTGCAGYQSVEGGSGGGERLAGAPTVDAFWRVYQRYQGTPYVYGGNTAAGLDCSGFIRAAYREALGRNDLPRTTARMLAEGDFVRLDQLQPGDLVFFRIGGKEQHAGIFLEGNRFIHASTSQGVTESSLANRYWRNRYSQARRMM